MAIINNAHPGSQINLLCLIYRVLHRSPNKYNLEELYNTCRPEELLWKNDHKKRFRENFNFWKKESWRLWAEDENQKLYLTEQNGGSASTRDVANLVRDKFFEEIDENFLEPENKEVAQLYRSLAFILSLHLFAPFGGESLTVKKLDAKLQDLFIDYQLNDSEKAYFLEYCHFLGFLEIKSATHQETQYVVDPTEAVKSVLEKIFVDRTHMAIRDFIRALSGLLPVLDGGYYKSNVENYLESKNSMTFNSNQISAALSHALQRIYHMGIIKFEVLSDDRNAMSLTLPIESGPISVVQFNREAY